MMLFSIHAPIVSVAVPRLHTAVGMPGLNKMHSYVIGCQ